MHRVAFKILGNNADAEEVVQETLFKMFRNKTVPDLEDEAIAAKLSAATKNMALDFYAKLVKHQAIHYEDGINTDDPGMCVPSLEASINDIIDLQRCIERLPRLQKEYIQLRFDQDLSIKEIAEQLRFCAPSHFARVFRKITGLLPQQYRKENYK